MVDHIKSKLHNLICFINTLRCGHGCRTRTHGHELAGLNEDWRKRKRTRHEAQKIDERLL